MTLPNMNGGDAGADNAFSMVLDNLGMDDELANSLAGDGFDGVGDDDPEVDIQPDGSFNQRDQYTRQPDNRVDPARQQDNRRQQFGDRQPGQQQQPQRRDGRDAPATAVRADQRGNLVDQQGRIIARAGYEASMYQEVQNGRRQVMAERARTEEINGRLSRAVDIGRQLHERVTHLQAQIQASNPSRFGLNDQEAVSALQLFAEAKRDPTATIKKLLTMAAAGGVDVRQLGIAPGGVDAKSLVDIVRSEIAKVVQPIQQRTEQDQQREENMRQAAEAYRETENEVKSFFSQNPEAQAHLPVFEAVLSTPQFQHMSLGEVWARIQLNQERMTRDSRYNGSNGNINPALRRNQQRRNIPAGRGNPPSGMDILSEMAPVSASYDTILRETFDALGVV